MSKELGPSRTAAVMAQQGKASMTMEEAKELVMSYWPTAPELEVKKAALMCKRYNMDPGRRQIHLMPFQRKVNGGVVMKDGKPVTDWSIAVGIGFTRIMGRRQTDARYTRNSPRPATEEEQILYRGKVDKTHLWHICWLKNQKTGEEVFGLGNWPLDARGNPYSVKGSDKGNTPEHMCDIRAERAAWDKLCPDWVEPGVKVYDERYADLPEPENENQKEINTTGTSIPKIIQAPNGEHVDTATGEIVDETSAEETVEGVFDEVPSEEEDGDPQPEVDGDLPAIDTLPKVTTITYKTDPDSIKNLGLMYAAAFRDWPEKFKLKAHVLKFLHKTETEIAIPADEYKEIVRLIALEQAATPPR